MSGLDTSSLLVSKDRRHAAHEKRFSALGATNGKRFLAAVFTIRRGKIRIISARPMSRKEREFWHTHDTTEYFDYSKSHRVTIQFDPSVEEPVKLISMRLPREMLNKLKAMATKRDVPYQSLIKMILAEKLEGKAA